MSVAKAESAETCTQYDVAPAEAFQVKVGEVETPEEPLMGEARVGALGAGGGAVTKRQAGENGPAPVALDALTCQ